MRSTHLKVVSIILFYQMTVMIPVLADAPPADMIIVNGAIHTMDKSRPTAQMVAVVGDRIVHVGDRSAFNRWAGPSTKIIDLKDRAMTPGLIESHAHILYLGYARMKLDLSKAENYDQVVKIVAAAAADAPPGEWILGSGWHQSKWNPPPRPQVKGFQTHHALSAVTPDNPVYLTHASGHAGMANAKAMQIAGVTAQRQILEGGEVIKDPQGQPTGIFIESAQELILWHIPETTTQKRRQALELAIDESIASGITTFFDASSDRAAIDLYEEFLRQGRLRLRLWVMINGQDKELLKEWYSRGPLIDTDNHFLTIRAIKLFADGALGSRGAWLLAPYADRPGHSGHAIIPMEEVFQTAAAALNHGFQLCVHAIGDRANREVLNQFERALNTLPQPGKDHRFRIEHAQHIDPKDIPRLAQLGVIASMQGIHLSSDRPWAIDRLGIKRIEDSAYVWQKLIRSGAIVVNGTDAPVEPINPIANFYASVTRKRLDGQPPGGYEADQKMTRRQALASYTLHAAYAGFAEKRQGSIQTGKLADFTIFSQDIMTIPEDRILSTQVDYTIVGGNVVYHREQDANYSVDRWNNCCLRCKNGQEQSARIWTDDVRHLCAHHQTR